MSKQGDADGCAGCIAALLVLALVGFVLGFGWHLSGALWGAL